MAASIFVVATGQHVGKTTISLGLAKELSSRGLKVGFAKPVGQQYVMREGVKVDKDVVLMQSALHVGGALADMSPVTVPRGFVRDYLFHRDPKALRDRIIESYARLSEDCDVMVIEGTGHTGVGSCFDLSNADVAALLGSKVLLIVEGGVGSALDLVALNLNMLESRNVEVIGVVANKLLPEKRERTAEALEQGLANMGHTFLGAIPYEAAITYPRVRQVADAVNAEVLCGHDHLDSRIYTVLVAAMEPQNVIPRIKPRSLMITPGDRVDNILVALNAATDCGNLVECIGKEGGRHLGSCVSGLLLTGGFIPHFSIVGLLKNSDLPVLLCKDNTYEVSSKVQQLVFKILPEDKDKILQAEDLVQRYVDTEKIIGAIQETRHAAPAARRG